MNSKPILFNTEMVKAILDGRKTQFRKICGFDILDDELHFSCDKKSYIRLCDGDYGCPNCGAMHFRQYQPKYKVGDVLWVREPAKVTEINDYQDCFTFKYLADNKEETLSYLDKWENEDGMTVPRWVENCQGVPNGCIKEMARIFLKVTNVRVERLQDIRVRDIEKETGWKRKKYSYSNKNRAFYKDYRDLWNSTTKDGYKWEDNPYVFVYKFERIKK